MIHTKESTPVLTEDFAVIIKPYFDLIPDGTEPRDLIRYSNHVGNNPSRDQAHLAGWYEVIDSLPSAQRSVLNKLLASLARALFVQLVQPITVGDLRDMSPETIKGGYADNRGNLRGVGDRGFDFLVEIGLILPTIHDT